MDVTKDRIILAVQASCDKTIHWIEDYRFAAD